MANTRRNVALLAACQAMLLANNSTLTAINGLAGLALAPSVLLATLPVTFWVLGSALTTMAASLHMRRVGRREGLMQGAAMGVLGVLVCAIGVWRRNFWLLCAGALICGTYNAYGQYYRFAAAEVSSGDFRATAISLVLAGGLVGGVLGPATSRVTIDLLDAKFVGAYVGLSGFALITIALLAFIRIPDATESERKLAGRPIWLLARQPKFAVAVIAAALSYGVMNLLMTSTPIAMHACGHPYGAAASVISAHMIGMFAPSFFTGTLIKRIGLLPIMFIGGLLNALAIGIAASGVGVANFWASLVLIGVGWNFLYIGGTTLLTETYRPEERAKAQGFNEFVVFAMMAVSSLTSGMMVTQTSWALVNLTALIPIAVVLAAIAWLAFSIRSALTVRRT